MSRAGSIAACVLYLTAAVAAQDLKVSKPYAQALGGGVVRFFESEEAFKAAPQSFVLEAPPRGGFSVPEGFPLTPEFAVVDGKRRVTVKMPAGATLYGLGGEPGAISRSGFKSGADPVACPWAMGLRPDGTAFGVLMDTSYRCWADVNDAVIFTTEAPHPAVILLDAQGPRELLVALNELTGRMEMPPRWALGMGVMFAGDLRDGVRHLRDAQVPFDHVMLVNGANGLVLGSKPEPSATELLADLSKQNLRVAVYAPTDVAAALDNPRFESGNVADAWIRLPDGSPMGSALHPPWFMPDYTRADVRAWWARAVRDFAQSGVDGLSVAPVQMRFKDEAILKADAEFGGSGSGLQYHAWLPVLWQRAAREGFAAEQRDRRPMVWSDRYIPSMQRWAASPIPARNFYAATVPLTHLRGALSLTLSGQPLVHAPIPGVLAAKERTGEFVGLDSLMPLVSSGAIRFDDTVAITAEHLQLLRLAMTRRSRLIPYLYTLCFNAFFRCEPILRPLFFFDPKDPALRDVDSAFLVGEDLLVVPRLAADKPKPPCPLKGSWRKIDFGDGDNPDLPDLYLRPGAILPLGPVMQFTNEKPVDPLTLLINLDESGVAVGKLYEDDGDGYAFYKNQARIIGYRAEVKDGSLYVRLAFLDGAMPLPTRKVEVRLLTDKGEVTGVGSERGTIKIDLPKDPAPAPPAPPPQP